MRKIIIVFFVLILLTACANDEKEITKINIPTAATTGSLYPLGSSIAELWNKEVENINVSAQASNGGIDNLNLLQKKEAQISMGITSIVYDSYHGKGLFEGRENKDLRIIAGLYLNPNQIIVKKEIGIESIKDLKGKNFASGAPGSTTESETAIHLKTAGLNYPEDLNVQFVGFTESIDLMRNRQIDGAWIMAGVPTAAVTEMITTANAKILPIEQELLDKIKEQYPWYVEYTIPKGMYPSQEEEIKTTAVKLVMYTSADMPEDLIYELTKVFWENIESLKISNKALEKVEITDATEDLAGIPLHPGAEKYYSEVNNK